MAGDLFLFTRSAGQSLFLLFYIVAFAVPTAKTATFWVAFVFTAIAFIAQIIIWKTAFGKDETLKSKFLGLPIVHIGVVYLIVQLIVFAVFLAFSMLAVWISLVVCALVLGISAVCLISTEIGKDEVVRVEQKVKEKMSFIQELQVDIEMLAEAESDAQTKTALIKLAERIRYSDPMSSDELTALEEAILNKVAVLKMENEKLPVIDELDSLLTERNKKCKISK